MSKKTTSGKPGRSLTIGEVLFSSGTYQVEVTEKGKKESQWPFIQIKDSGELLDAFCSCAEVVGSRCIHLDTAYKFITALPTPLHVRYRSSFWMELFKIAFERILEKAPTANSAKETIEYHSSSSGKQVFSLKIKNRVGKDLLKQWIFNKVAETEETSLKFSNLTPLELKLWKEGRPSLSLRYELSFWSDLAKWCFLTQERKEYYTIEYRYQAGETLPKGIDIHFETFEIFLYLPRACWPEIIPTLKTVNSPLKLFATDKYRFIGAEYNREKRQFDLAYEEQKEKIVEEKKKIHSLKEEDEKSHSKELQIEDWIYSPYRGFFPKKSDERLIGKEIPFDKIGSFLDQFSEEIKPILSKETPMLEGVYPLLYEVYFDDEFSLHIDAYVKEKGDLKNAEIFDHWILIEGLGFLKIETSHFGDLFRVIRKEQVPQFIEQHLIWLKGVDGFWPHVALFESQLTYEVTPDKSLKIIPLENAYSQEGELIDFGLWVYVKGSGFYPKGQQGMMMSGLATHEHIPFDDVSSFLHAKREDLESIPNLFARRSPILKTGLKLELIDKGIAIQPKIALLEEYQERKVEFFGDFTFVEGEGFHLIPQIYQIPPRYTSPTIIHSLEIPLFLKSDLPILLPFVIHLDPRLKVPETLSLFVEKVEILPASVRFSIYLSSEVGKSPLSNLWHELKGKKSYAFTDSGLLFLSDPRFQWIKQMNGHAFQEGAFVELGVLDWIRLEASWPMEMNSKDKEQLDQFLKDLISPEEMSGVDLTGFKSDLRTYQRKGLSWLWMLYRYRLSGILADEMGLGKTHQAMAMMVALFNYLKQRGGEPKFLVVCPTSVIYHWQTLLQKFAPNLRVHFYYGLDRVYEGWNNHAEVLLTSYGTLRNDHKLVMKEQFDIAIFDEMQVAKNAHSQTHKALRGVKATLRLGLTGTPIENQLLELKALLDILLPGYFPSEELFKSQFSAPIEKSEDTKARNFLTKLVHPFILRRRKKEVLKELPDKIEEVVYCPLSAEQEKWYNAAMNQVREELLPDLLDENKPVEYIHVFAMLSKLKQICNHPALAAKTPEKFASHHSGKWDLFVDLLQNALCTDQKVVVFSQFLNMLDIIELYLKECGIQFASLRGSTRDRKAEIDRFSTDPNCKVFVGSLQAAGVGIDLIAASVVIHFDRWWNPAKENQATDRVHRLGQTRGVQVFKLVTKGTIEEHIEQMIERKKRLVEGIITYDDPREDESPFSR